MNLKRLLRPWFWHHGIEPVSCISHLESTHTPQWHWHQLVPIRTQPGNSPQTGDTSCFLNQHHHSLSLNLTSYLSTTHIKVSREYLFPSDFGYRVITDQSLNTAKQIRPEESCFCHDFKSRVAIFKPQFLRPWWFKCNHFSAHQKENFKTHLIFDCSAIFVGVTASQTWEHLFLGDPVCS